MPAWQVAFDNHRGAELRAATLLGLVLANAANLALYVRALRLAGSVVGSVVNTATNIAVSGLLGSVVFDEGDALGFRWWAGTCVVTLGLALIATSSSSESASSQSASSKSASPSKRVAAMKRARASLGTASPASLEGKRSGRKKQL